ncbi:MaoC family dehydratase [Paraburkholderia hayleyella]|uniref:MaoC family dehydratase n=1 Tax=Paraburkholderia hayleyella TaxID=2152889 RepID=UPI001FE88738|nr:MaoC/PaaZ C-terminal domain-containing protein [Paraburkholderia hayleyella]
MPTVLINSAPGAPLLYARTLSGLFKRGRPSHLPSQCLVRPAALLDPVLLARYSRICGFVPQQGLPLTFPHLLAFPLQMLLLTDPAFPWPALGLVHLANHVRQHQPLTSGEIVRVEVECGALLPHAKGQAFVMHSRLYRQGAMVWDSESLYLRRGAASSGTAPPAMALPRFEREALTQAQRWTLPAHLGRDYAHVSGDYNPIHLSTLSAKAFGFPHAIAHGMWTLARTIAALQPNQRLEQASVDAEFKLPLLLPGTATLWRARPAFAQHEFEVRDAAGSKPHLRGRLYTVPA